MDIDGLITEKIQRLQDLNRQMGEISKKIGALQEEGRALHGVALEVKGAIEGLAELKTKEELKAKEAADKAKGLILPDKTLVAPDGKTPIAKAEEAAPTSTESQPTADAEGRQDTKPEVVLEVK